MCPFIEFCEPLSDGFVHGIDTFIGPFLKVAGLRMHFAWLRRQHSAFVFGFPSRFYTADRFHVSCCMLAFLPIGIAIFAQQGYAPLNDSFWSLLCRIYFDRSCIINPFLLSEDLTVRSRGSRSDQGGYADFMSFFGGAFPPLSLRFKFAWPSTAVVHATGLVLRVLSDLTLAR